MPNPEERKWCVYMHRFPNKKVYIGQTCKKAKDRWGKDGSGYMRKDKNGNYKQPYMARAVKNCDWNKVEHEILFDNLTFKEANRIEQVCIALFRAKDSRFGYNLTEGGSGTPGRNLSEETKQKIGEKAKIRMSTPDNVPFYGKHHTEETKEILRQINIGRHHTEESKKKMSESRMGIFLGGNGTTAEPVICIDLGLYFDCIKSAAEAFGVQRASVSKVVCGLKPTSAGHYFIRVKDFSIEKVRELLLQKPDKKVPIICIETGKIFGSITDASKDMKIDGATISRCIYGKGQTAGGLHWRKATEEEWIAYRSKFVEPIIASLLSNQTLMAQIESYQALIAS